MQSADNLEIHGILTQVHDPLCCLKSESTVVLKTCTVPVENLAFPGVRGKRVRLTPWNSRLQIMISTFQLKLKCIYWSQTFGISSCHETWDLEKNGKASDFLQIVLLPHIVHVHWIRFRVWMIRRTPQGHLHWLREFKLSIPPKSPSCLWDCSALIIWWRCGDTSMPRPPSFMRLFGPVKLTRRWIEGRGVRGVLDVYWNGG